MINLQAGEQVMFPSPYVPTEHHALVITNRRVVRFAEAGPYPIGEFEVSQLDFVGRQQEKPYVGVAVMLGLVGLILLIAAGWKLLPAVLYAGNAQTAEAQLTDDGRLVEGKNADDEYPFFDKEIQEKSKKISADRLKDLKKIKPGLPSWSADVGWGLAFLVLGLGPLMLAGVLWRKEQHCIYCRTKDNNMHRIEMQSAMQQNMVLATLQAVQQTAR